eukprot:Skav209373  [mRNA]  locus=scaffold64:64578:66485:+ [translate_table: standard]
MGKVFYNVTVGELLEQFHTNALTSHLVFRLVGGGAKDTQRTYIKNSLAASLLQQGFPMEWTANTLETMIKNVGIKRLTQLVSMPHGKARLDQTIQLIKDCAIDIPDKVFHEAKGVSSKAAQQAKSKKRWVQPDPQHYQLETSYLLNEDDSNPTQLTALQPNLSGIMLMSLEQATPWITENRTMSRDELAIAVVGNHQLQTTLEFCHCNLPCRDIKGVPVILAVTLVQMGAKKIRAQVTDKHVDEDKCVTVSVTLWQEDWASTEWTKIIDNTIGYVRHLLKEAQQHTAFEAMWGRSLRSAESKNVGDALAQSVQIHAAVRLEKLNETLQSSGFNRLFLTPKDADGRPSGDWRIIWLEGSLAHLTSLSTRTEHCAGLTRNRNSWGLRYHRDHFDKAWAVLCPDKPKPSNLQLKYIYRVEPLPFGATSEMLLKWSQLISWDFKPMKAMGPRTWLIGSQQPCPDGVICFNSSPVIIRLIPPKSPQQGSAVVAGPQPRKMTALEVQGAADPWTAPGAASTDPWANFTPTTAAKAAAAPRTVQGPIESRFNQQEQRLDQMEQALTQLRNDTQQGFQNVEQREKKTHAVIAQVKHELESSFTQAINQQSSQLNTTLADLKTLLVQRTKRDRELAEDEEMETK